MKKSCEGCKALESGRFNDYYSVCDLGYEVDSNKAIPFENCPKPRTFIRLIELKKLRDKYKLEKEELAEWKF